jgi:hypothetical protein
MDFLNTELDEIKASEMNVWLRELASGAVTGKQALSG